MHVHSVGWSYDCKKKTVFQTSKLCFPSYVQSFVLGCLYILASRFDHCDSSLRTLYEKQPLMAAEYRFGRPLPGRMDGRTGGRADSGRKGGGVEGMDGPKRLTDGRGGQLDGQTGRTDGRISIFIDFQGESTTVQRFSSIFNADTRRYNGFHPF